MNFDKKTAEIYVPDGRANDVAIASTTHLCVAAHQDDIEIMAYHGVAQCFGKQDKGFMGVVVTDGAGSPRDDLYKDYTDAEMQKVRRLEQKKAAFVGEYCALALLDHTSSEVKNPSLSVVIDDIKNIILNAAPEVVYTHNLADKHDTHVSVALRVIAAIRSLPTDKRPKKVIGCEVWRGLDWLNDNDKVILDVDVHENIATALVSVFDSQICGGKRYDLATTGRRRANATYYASHGTDDTASLNFGIDLTPLIEDDSLDCVEYIMGYINRFGDEVSGRVGKLNK